MVRLASAARSAMFILSFTLIEAAAAKAPHLPPAEIGRMRRDVEGLEAAGRFEQALARARRTLDELHRSGGLDEQYVDTLEFTRQIAYSHGFYDKALVLNRSLVSGTEHLYGAKSLKTIVAVQKLAANLYRLGRASEALPLFERAIDFFENDRHEDAASLGPLISNVALVYDTTGRIQEAEKEARRAVAYQQAAATPNPTSLAFSMDNLAMILQHVGQYDEAERLHLQARAAFARQTDVPPPDVALNYMQTAELRREQHRFPEAEADVLYAIHILGSVFSPDSVAIADPLLTLGEMKGDQARYAEAETMFARCAAILGPAVKAGRAEADVETYVRAQTYLATAYVVQRKLDLARHAGLEAVEHLSGAGEQIDVLLNLATVLEQVGESDTAASIDRALLSRLKERGESDSLYGAVAGNNLAMALTAKHRYAEALSAGENALRTAEKATGITDGLKLGLYRTLADLLSRAGRLDEADRDADRALDMLAGGAGEPDENRFGALVAGRRGLRIVSDLKLRIAFAIAAKDPKRQSATFADGFSAAQTVMASAASRTLSQMTARASLGSRDLERTMRDLQDVGSQRAAVAKLRISALAKGSGLRDPDGERELAARSQELLGREQELRNQLARSYPAYAELTAPKPVPLAEAQALLAPDEAMLVYTTAEDATYLWALRRDRSAAFRIDLGAEALGAEVEALRGLLDPQNNVGRRPFDVERSHALYERIVVPAEPLLDGARTVIVVPDGPLQSMPFDVLVTAPGAAVRVATDYRNVAWLARTRATTVLPSVSSLRALRRTVRPSVAARPFIGIGDPVLAEPPGCRQTETVDDVWRGTQGDVDAVRRLCSLPESHDELRALARAFRASDGDLYLRGQATKAIVGGLPLSDYRVLAFATHGLVAGEVRGLAEPALVLTPPVQPKPGDDGLLTASDVAQLKLDADWVILSACNTAAGDKPGAEGLSGLAQAFFYAGARSLLVSHWAVDSLAAERLTVDTLDALEKDPQIGRAQALQRAEMALLDRGAPDMAHPMFWAPFALIGEGGRGR